MCIYTVETDYSSTPYDSLVVATKWYDESLGRLAAGDKLVTHVSLVHKYYNQDNEFTIKVLCCTKGEA